MTPPDTAVNVTSPGNRFVVIVNDAEFCPCRITTKLGIAVAVITELLRKSTRTPPTPAELSSVAVAVVLVPPTT